MQQILAHRRHTNHRPTVDFRVALEKEFMPVNGEVWWIPKTDES
jgi:hypothetical protein